MTEFATTKVLSSLLGSIRLEPSSSMEYDKE